MKSGGGAGQGFPVAGLHLGHQAPVLQVAHRQRMIPPKDRHIGKVPAAQHLPVVGGNGVLGAAGFGVHGRQVQRRADLGVGAHPVAELHDPGLGQHQMVIHLVEGLAVGQHPALGQPDGAGMQDHGVLLVDGEPVLHLAAKLGEQHPGIVFKSVDGGAVGPAALFFQAPGQIKVVHRDHRLDAVGPAGPDDGPVMVHTGLVHRPGTVGQNAGPGDGKAVGFQPHPGKQLDVLRKAVVVVAGHRKVGIARRVFVLVDDGGAFAVGVPATLHLIGRSGGAPEEIFREIQQLLVDHGAFPFFTGRSAPGRRGVPAAR